jgi:hypothetical protein
MEQSMTPVPTNDFVAATQRTTASPASLMLANMPIYYSADDALVELLEKALGSSIVREPVDLGIPGVVAEIVRYDEDAPHRAWADQFGRDVVAAGKKRAKGKK